MGGVYGEVSRHIVSITISCSCLYIEDNAGEYRIEANKQVMDVT
jgi:hypothetical protein